MTAHWGQDRPNPTVPMRERDLFQLALGITSPWFVASSQFDAVKRRLDIKLDFKAGIGAAAPHSRADRLMA